MNFVSYNCFCFAVVDDADNIADAVATDADCCLLNVCDAVATTGVVSRVGDCWL